MMVSSTSGSAKTPGDRRQLSDPGNAHAVGVYWVLPQDVVLYPQLDLFPEACFHAGLPGL